MPYLRKKLRNDKRTLEEIAKAFSDHVLVELGLQEPTIEENTTIEKTASSASKAANAVMYDEHGHAQDLGKQSVMNSGFDVCMYVSLKKGDKVTQWNIKDIMGDGSVVLLPIDPNSGDIKEEEPLSMGAAVFLEKFKKADKQIEFLQNYPEIDPARSLGLTGPANKGVIQECLRVLVEGTPLPSVKCMTQPAKKVIVTEAHQQKGAFCITPGTLTVNEYNKDKFNIDSQIIIDGGSRGKFTIGSSNNKKIHSIFWDLYSGSVSQESKANCEIVEKVVSYKGATMGNRNTNEIEKISFPCISNTRPLALNEQLLLYRAPKVKAAPPPKREAAVLIEPKAAQKPEAKRQKP